MADPISIAGMVFTCGSIVKALVTLYETLKDGPAALKEHLSRTTALELLLKRLQAFEQQLNSDRKEFLTAFFDASKCQETIMALAALVKQTKPAKEGFHQDLKGRIKWLLNKSDAEGLVAKLLKQQTDIAMAINMISSESIQNILQIVARNQPVKAFEEALVPMVERRHVWFGQRNDIEELRLNRQYVQDRARFADAAFWGDWPTVLSGVRTYGELYGQLWINSTRMTSSPDRELSGFTALHHAAYHGAPVEVAHQLVAMGAWRTARAIRVPREDMTPLDIARSAGFDHLYEVLSPVIRHTISSKTLSGLERKLHELIRHNEAVERRLIGLRLPDLSVLLELEAMEMWVPVTALSESGYLLRIDGRELLVKSILPPKENRFYRITEDKIFKIEEAVLAYR